MKIRIG